LLPTIETRAFPVVRITYPALLTDRDVDGYVEALGEVLRRGRIGTVVDIRALDPKAVGAAERQYLAAAIDRMTAEHPNRLVAEAIVMNSALLRGLYTAYCWVRRDASYPSRAFRDVAAAESWVRGQLRADGLLSDPS